MRLCPTDLSLLLLAVLLCACAGQQTPVAPDTTSDTTTTPSPVVPTDTATEGDVDTAGDPTIATPANIAGDEAGLFTDSAIEGDLDTAGDPTIVRTRFVNINFDVLGWVDGLQEDESEISHVLVLNLFEDAVFTALLERVEANSPGSFSWIGHLEGVEYSQVILVVKDGLMAGNITLPKTFYQVRYAGNGVHAIYQIDQSAFPPEDEPVSPDG